MYQSRRVAWINHSSFCNLRSYQCGKVPAAASLLLSDSLAGLKLAGVCLPVLESYHITHHQNHKLNLQMCFRTILTQDFHLTQCECTGYLRDTAKYVMNSASFSSATRIVLLFFESSESCETLEIMGILVCNFHSVKGSPLKRIFRTFSPATWKLRSDVNRCEGRH